MKLTSAKTYHVIYYLLENREFTQLTVSKDTLVSFGQVNKVVSWLIRNHFVEKKGNHYFVTDPSGLVVLFALDRNMNALLVKTIKTSMPPEKLIPILGKNHVLCLDSALNQYSNYYRSNRVCVYVQNEKEIKEIEKEVSNNNTGFVDICLFKTDIDPELGGKKLKATTKLRTLIDLVCDNKTFYAKDLFKQLWGVTFNDS